MASSIKILRAIALILISTTLCSAEATVPVAATPAIDAKSDDGAQLPGLFQEKISAAITAKEWPNALDLIDRYLAVVQRTPPVTTDDGSSYRDVRTLTGFRDQVSVAAGAYEHDRKSPSFRQAELDHLQKSAQEAGKLEIAAELFIPLSPEEIAAIKELLNDPEAQMKDPAPSPPVEQMMTIRVTRPDYLKAIALARTVDPKQWGRYKDDGVFAPSLYALPLPEGNPTPYSAILIDLHGFTFFEFEEFVRKAPNPWAIPAKTATAPAAP